MRCVVYDNIVINVEADFNEYVTRFAKTKTQNLDSARFHCDVHYQTAIRTRVKSQYLGAKMLLYELY